MAFTRKATLIGTGPTVPINTSDTPGYPVGTRMMGLGEPAQAEKFNRAFVALLDNTDDLDDRVSHDIAQPVTYRINLVVPTSTITVGTGGAIDPTADGYTTLFMGSTGWANTLDNRRKLFSITGGLRDAVLVDNSEVSLTSVSGVSVGGGFVDIASTLRTITLSQTLPAGGYYIGFFCGSTAGTIHEAALCELTRGMQEVPAASGKRTGVVCAMSTNEGPADYLGDQSVLQAILDGYETIYIRGGTYGPYAVPLVLDGIFLLGAGENSVTIQTSSRIEIANGGGAERISFVTDGAPSVSTYISLGNQSTIRELDCDGFELQFIGQNVVVQNIKRCGGSSGVFSFGNSSNVALQNVKYDSSYSTVPLITFSAAHDIVVENVTPYVAGTVVDEICLYFSSGTSPERIAFRNCLFETGNEIALSINNDLLNVTWDNCTFKSQQQVVDTPNPIEAVGSYFRHCRFLNTATTWHRSVFVRLTSLINPAQATFPNANLCLDECYFFDRWATGHTDASNPGGVPAGGGTSHNVMLLSGVTGRNIKFNRFGLDYLVMDAPMIVLEHCNIDGFHFTQQFNPDGMVPYVYGTESTCMLSVSDQSRINDMTVYAQIDSNGITNPVSYIDGLIRVVGGSYSRSGSPDYPDGRTLVNGLYVCLSGSAQFPTGKAVLVIWSATVRGFVWPRTNSVGHAHTNTSDMLVFLKGSRAGFEDFDIYIDCVNNCEFETVIGMGDAITDSALRVRDGKIYALPHTGDGFDRPHHFVLSTSTNPLVQGVEMVFDGNRLSALQPCVDLSGTQYAKFMDNHLQIRGTAPDSGATYYNAVTFPVAALPTTPNAPCGGGIAIGNVINVTGAAASPIMFPAAVMGNSLNYMVTDGITDPGV